MIRPLAFDQFDHAQRIERFGLGVWLRSDRELEAAMDRLLDYQVAPSAPLVPNAPKIAAHFIHKTLGLPT